MILTCSSRVSLRRLQLRVDLICACCLRCEAAVRISEFTSLESAIERSSINCWRSANSCLHFDTSDTRFFMRISTSCALFRISLLYFLKLTLGCSTAFASCFFRRTSYFTPSISARRRACSIALYSTALVRLSSRASSVTS